MSSKGQVVYGSSLRGWTLTIILCAVVWWASAAGTSRNLTPVFWPDALAQEAVPATLKITAPSTLWSLEQPGSNTTPHLVIGMTDRRDTLPYGSFESAGDEATNRSVGNTVTRQVGPAASANRSERIEADPLVLSSLLDPTGGIRGSTNFREEPTNPRQTSQISPDLAATEVYTLLDDRSAPGSFLYKYQANYFPSKQWIADDESFTNEVAPAPRPLLQLEFGGWRLPVALSGSVAQ